MTVAADPDALTRLARTTAELSERITRSAGDVADALVTVQVRCLDDRPALGPLDHELHALATRWRAVAAATDAAGADLAAADMSHVGLEVLPSTIGQLGNLATLDGTDPQLAERLARLPADPRDSAADAVLRWLRRRAADLNTLGNVRSFLLDVGRLAAAAGAPDGWFLRWATGGLATSRLDGLARWATIGQAVNVGVDAVEVGRAFDTHRSGAQQVSAVGRTTFDAGSLACQTAPSLWSCGAAVVGGATWAGAEAYLHRKQIGDAAEMAGGVGGALLDDRYRALRAAVERHVEQLPAAVDRIADVVRAVDRRGRGIDGPIIPPGLRQLVDRTTTAIGDGLEPGARTIGDTVHVVDAGMRAGGGAVRDGAATVGHGIERGASSVLDWVR